MIWTIDTGSLGGVGCEPSKLKAFLLDEVAHHAKTVVSAAGADVYRTAGPAPVEQEALVQHHVALNLKVDAAKKAVEAKLPAVQEQMKNAVDAACTLAQLHDGNVCVSICGHHDVNHASGVGNRVQISVDDAPHVADGPSL